MVNWREVPVNPSKEKITYSLKVFLQEMPFKNRLLLDVYVFIVPNYLVCDVLM